MTVSNTTFELSSQLCSCLFLEQVTPRFVAECGWEKSKFCGWVANPETSGNPPALHSLRRHDDDDDDDDDDAGMMQA